MAKGIQGYAGFLFFILFPHPLPNHYTMGISFYLPRKTAYYSQMWDGALFFRSVLRINTGREDEL